MARKLSNSLEAMGLKRFVNTKYPQAARGDVTPYQWLDSQFAHDIAGTAIAETFIIGQILTRAAISKWRKRWRLEKEHPELKQGGLPND